MYSRLVQVKKSVREKYGDMKKGRFFQRMVCIYAVCTILVFLLFSTILCASVQRNHLKQIRRMNERALNQSVSACSTTLSNLYNYFYLEILDSTELVELLLANQYSQDLSVRYRKLNTMLINYSSLVDSCYVVNLKGGFVCSTLDTYYSIEDFPDQDIVQRLYELQGKGGSYELIPRKTSYQMRKEQYEKQYISLIFRKYREGYLVINLDYDGFINTVNYRNYDGASRALLVNVSGLVLADSSEQLFGCDISDSDYYEMMLGQEDAEGNYRVKIEGGRKNVVYRKEQGFGISYLTIMDAAMIGNNTLLFQVILYALCAMAVNLALILLGTNVLYHPISELQQRILTNVGGENMDFDEFKMMEGVFNRLKRTSGEYVKSRKKKVLSELLEDKTIQGAEQLEELSEIQAELNRAFFLCVNLYLNADELEAHHDDRLLMNFAMENLLREKLENIALVESVDLGQYVTCVINADLPDGQRMNENMEDTYQAVSVTALEMIIKALREMQEKMQEYFELDVTCSVGMAVNSLDDISESYKNALMAAFFQTTKETAAVLYREEPEDGHKKEEQIYPAEMVKELLNEVKAGNQEEINSCIQRFFAWMTSYPYDQAVRCILMLEMDIARLEMKYSVHRENTDWEIVDGVHMGMRLYKMQETCLQRCLDVAEAYRETRENDPNIKQIVEKVKALIDSKITDPALTVNVIAQEMFLSTSYLRSIFKEKTGHPLSGYIIQKRLEMICRLLLDTDWSIQQIADHMGFSSRSYFYTFFKNYMGMTPSQYRKNKAAGEESGIPEIEESAEE